MSVRHGPPNEDLKRRPDCDATGKRPKDVVGQLAVKCKPYNISNSTYDISYVNGSGDEAYLVVLEKTAGEAGDDGVDPGTETQAVGVVPAEDDVLAFAVNGVDITMATMTGDIATDMAAVLASSGVDTALSAGAVVSANRRTSLRENDDVIIKPSFG